MQSTVHCVSSLRLLATMFAPLVAVIGVACGSAPSEAVATSDLEPSASAPSTGEAAHALTAQAAPASTLTLSVSAPPRPVTTTDERRHLVYEFLVQNTSDQAQTLAALSVSEPGRRAPLASFAGNELRDMLLSDDPVAGSIEPGGLASSFSIWRWPRTRVSRSTCSTACAPGQAS